MSYVAMRSFMNLVAQATRELMSTAAASRPENRFTCGDCDRNAQCGRAPDVLCVTKAMQISRGLPPNKLRWPLPVS